jgi:hypothetical protein
MKKIYQLISTALLAVFALGSQSVSAAESSITLQVPFAFVVEGKPMPAGLYIVETSGSVVAIRGSAGSAMVTSGPRSIRRDAAPGLIFSRRGTTTYLVGVRTEDDARSIGLSPLQRR